MMCLTEMNPPLLLFFYKVLIASESPKSGSEDVKQILRNTLNFIPLKKGNFRLQIEPGDHTPLCCSKPWPAPS